MNRDRFGTDDLDNVLTLAGVVLTSIRSARRFIKEAEVASAELMRKVETIDATAREKLRVDDLASDVATVGRILDGLETNAKRVHQDYF